MEEMLENPMLQDRISRIENIRQDLKDLVRELEILKEDVLGLDYDIKIASLEGAILKAGHAESLLNTFLENYHKLFEKEVYGEEHY